MAKWKIFLAIVCSFLAGGLILLAVLVYIPRTTELEYNMRGFVISADGEILEEFTMRAAGEEYDFILDRPNGKVSFVGNTPERVAKDTLYLDIDWSSSTILKGTTPGLFTKDFTIPHRPVIVGDVLSCSSATEKMEREYGIFDSQRGIFYLYADALAEDIFIIGITDPDTDPLVVLKSYQSVEDHLQSLGLLPSTEN